MSKLLFIDSDKAYLDQLIQDLQKTYHGTIIQAYSLKEAISLIEEELIFDVIITEFKLDNNNTALDLLQKAYTTNATKFIINTNNLTKNEYYECESIRPVHYVSKDVPFFQFKQALQIQLDLLSNLGRDKIQNKFSVKVGDKYRIIDVEDIYYFEVDGKYLNIYLEKRSYNMRASLKEVMSKIPKYFVRVHGSFLVNTNKIVALQPSEQNIELSNNKNIPFSRNFRRPLFQVFNFV